MSTILYRNAVMLINGAEMTGALHELSLDYKAEILDETTFGDDTRIHKGGLYMASISGKGWFDGAVGIEAVLFKENGDASSVLVNQGYQSGSQIEDTIFLVFPDGVTEGSQTTGVGYAMKGVLADFNVGGAVGALLDVGFSGQSRGVA